MSCDCMQACCSCVGCQEWTIPVEADHLGSVLERTHHTHHTVGEHMTDRSMLAGHAYSHRSAREACRSCRSGESVSSPLLLQQTLLLARALGSLPGPGVLPSALAGLQRVSPPESAVLAVEPSKHPPVLAVRQARGPRPQQRPAG